MSQLPARGMQTFFHPTFSSSHNFIISGLLKQKNRTDRLEIKFVPKGIQILFL